MTTVNFNFSKLVDNAKLNSTKVSDSLDHLVSTLKTKIIYIQDTPSDLHQRAIQQIDKWDYHLDEFLPDFEIQKKIDRLGKYVERKFAPLTKFNAWLNHNGHGVWHHQLATFLVKLPFRAVRNIVQLLFNLLQGILYTAIHPIKSLNHLAKLFVNLLYALTRPETWSKIGIGIIGAGLGVALVLGTQLSPFQMGIGAALVIAGISVGAFNAAIRAEKESRLKAAKEAAFHQVKQLPESLLTGFLMGLIMGGIQKAFYEHKLQTFRVTTEEEAAHYVNKFCEQYHFPTPAWRFDPSSGKITLHWHTFSVRELAEARPDFFNSIYQSHSQNAQSVFDFQLELLPGHSEINMLIYEWHPDPNIGVRYWAAQPSLESFGLPSNFYPTPPIAHAQTSGYIGAATPIFGKVIC